MINLPTIFNNIIQRTSHPSNRVYKYNDSWSNNILLSPTSRQLKRLKQTINDTSFFFRPLADYIAKQYKNLTVLILVQILGIGHLHFPNIFQM